jgi:hypothetical protein
MARVFVAQEPMRKGASGRTQPAIDLTPARQFGELIYCLDWSDSKYDDPDMMLLKVLQTLDSIREDDYVLMVGSPTAMALVAGVAFCNCDSIRLLQWDKDASRYKVVPVNVSDVWDQHRIAQEN